MDERVHFIIDDILQDVIKRGTGRRALTWNARIIAGKTGTTNGPMDAWFSGYNPDVVTTTWVGFDDYTPLGRANSAARRHCRSG
jgi:penicillin-binding protein 1A